MAIVNEEVLTRNALLDSLNARLNGGTAAVIQIYSGTMPADADTALSGNTLLATLTASASMFGTASAASMTLNSVTDDSSADATGTATFARISTQLAGTVIIDVDVGTTGTTIILNTVSIVSGGTVSITSGTMTRAA